MNDFMRGGRGCLKWDGKPCSEQFATEHVIEIRLSMMALSSNELDFVFMGQIVASTNTSESLSTENIMRVLKG